MNIKQTKLIISIYCIHVFISIFCSCTSVKEIKANELGVMVTQNKKQFKYQVQKNDSLKLIALEQYIPNIIFEWKYADTANFTHQILYHNPIAFLRIEAAEKLKQAAIELQTLGLGFKVFDAYRPYSVTKKMWQIVPDENYAANPAKGSGHNRGAAIDLTLYSLKTGEELLMPTPFDEFSEKAHHNFTNLSEEILQNRKTLKDIMTKYGFVALGTEWWHYSIPNAAQKYNLLDIDFKKLKKLCK